MKPLRLTISFFSADGESQFLEKYIIFFHGIINNKRYASRRFHQSVFINVNDVKRKLFRSEDLGCATLADVIHTCVFGLTMARPSPLALATRLTASFSRLSRYSLQPIACRSIPDNLIYILREAHTVSLNLLLFQTVYCPSTS